MSDLDRWARDHKRRKLKELRDPSILANKKTMFRLMQRQIISKSTLLTEFGISREEEFRRLQDAE